MIIHQVNAFLIQAWQALLLINKAIARMRAAQYFIAKSRAQIHTIIILTNILKGRFLLVLWIFNLFLAKSTLI